MQYYRACELPQRLQDEIGVDVRNEIAAALARDMLGREDYAFVVTLRQQAHRWIRELIAENKDVIIEKAMRYAAMQISKACIKEYAGISIAAPPAQKISPRIKLSAAEELYEQYRE